MGTKSDIKRYASAFGAALPVTRPGPSDCYYCLIRDEHGTPFGDILNDHDHLRTHIEEDYFVPSLLRNALDAEGASQAVLRCVFIGGYPSLAEPPSPSVRRDVEHRLLRYLNARLGN